MSRNCRRAGNTTIAVMNVNEIPITARLPKEFRPGCLANIRPEYPTMVVRVVIDIARPVFLRMNRSEPGPSSRYR